MEEPKEEVGTTHFFGSFVTMPIPSPAASISKYVIIDGQQRLVTISILLAALRRKIIEFDKHSKIADSIYDQYLVNPYHETPEDEFKVVPTQADRDIFCSIIEKGANPNDEHLIPQAYDFFETKLEDIDDLEELKALKEALLNRFLVVDISLERGDAPYLIFESLNAKGSPLTQADLVRNYLFMRIKDEAHQRTVYNEIWFPMQEKLLDYLEDFIRHYLAMGGSIPNFNKIYATLKDLADRSMKSEKDVIEYMRRLAGFSDYYYRFLHPEKEKNGELRSRFEKLNELEVTTSYPLLLNLYNDFSNNKLSLEDFESILSAIETYIVRRAVCGVPTNVLNKYFPTMYPNVDKSDLVNSIKVKLKSEVGARRMPDDQEFERCLRERSLYRNRILRYILEDIEEYDNKETVDFNDLQVEHIMPRSLSNKWKKHLGENWELTHRKYLDTIGNLTLTGYNPEYSNREFDVKRDMEKSFKESNLRLNRDLAKLDKWTKQEIIARAEMLSNSALKIWNF